MTSNSIKPESTILGYTLKDRIGSGGYGEVWSAIAPGGIEKAVKFVYGFHDEKRAQTEIKALDRVKQLRHPFLLSLERIDIVDGQLVIISELAECCLAEIFNKYIAQGEVGIPREELLVYIRDAADALDYLTQTHSLQHLDIKPENLLIVSGHVKVADFGLVKDLDVTAQSLMTGMTPAYAAPELFDGQPGEKSDQYSLAIVYQEMLTSVRPFPGTTPAQLAAQHMHGRPNLRPLPKGDQSVIAKALSKDPAVRFASCREMVDELFNKKLRKKTIRRIAVPRQMADTDSNTLEINQTSRDMTAVVSSTNLPFQAVEIDKLDPPEIGDRQAELQPVIVVSIGNMSNQASSKLKQRLIARHGSVNELPSVRMICIDSNRQDLSELSMMGGAGSLSDKELVPTPLRKPEVYRDRAQSHLNWLSRRWIYNIPRSLQTEGLRPLGRLAFADHFEEICKKVQDAIKDVCVEENIANTSESLGIPPGAKVQPRVYVVSSISGGISGMTLDMAYTIKTLMMESGFEPSVTGILLHSTNRRAREPGLSAANSFALLTELRHYNDFGYPGDETLGLPEFLEEPPFNNVYYLDLGVDLNQTSLDEKLNSIAEWIYLNSLSKCSVFFDACREITKDSEHFDLRTFGLSINGPGKQVSGISQADALVVDLIKKWTGGGRDSSFEGKNKAVQFFNEFELHSDGITNIIDELLQKELSDNQFAEMLDESKKIVLEATNDHGQKLQDYFDSVFGIPSLRQEVGYAEPELCPRFESIVGNDAYPLGDQIAALAIDSLQSDKLDLALPQEFVKECYERLEQTKTRLEVAARGCESQLNDLHSVINELSVQSKRNSKTDSIELFEQCLQSYRQFRWQEFVLRNAKHFCQVVRKSLVAVDGMVEKYQTQLKQVSQRFEVKEEDDSFGTPTKSTLDLERLMMETVFRSQDKLIQRMEIQLFEELIREKGCFLDLLNESFSLQTELPEAMREVAIQVLTDAYQKISIDRVIAENKIAPEKVIGWLNEQMNLALPDVRQCGGGARLMAGFPQHAEESDLPTLIEKQFNVRPAGVNGTSGDLVLCFEGEEVALAGVAFKLLEMRPDAAELSKRIHVRKDIEWTTLNDLL